MVPRSNDMRTAASDDRMLRVLHTYHVIHGAEIAPSPRTIARTNRSRATAVV